MNKNILNSKVGLLFLAGFFLFNAGPCGAEASAAAVKDMPNFIIISLCSVRNSETIEDPSHQYIPHFWNTMLPQGALYTNLIDLNFEFHMPAVNAINTGRTYDHFPMPIEVPSIFQYVQKKYGLAQDKLWFMGGWAPDQCFFKTDEYQEDTRPMQITRILGSLVIYPSYKGVLTPQEETFINMVKPGDIRETIWDSLNEIMFATFKRILRDIKPKFVHYVMAGPESAHYDTFGRYVISIKRSDELIFETWKMIQQDPFYKDNTYLIIALDHTRDQYYMAHFDNTYDDPSRVWLYMYGPTIKKGVTINRPVYHRDIFATVADILGLKTHATEGKVLKDCFKEGNK